MVTSSIDPFLKKTLESSSLAYVIFLHEGEKTSPIIISNEFKRLFSSGDNFDPSSQEALNFVHTDDLEKLINGMISFANDKDASLDICYKVKVRGTYHQIHALGKHFPYDNKDYLVIIYNDRENSPSTYDESTFDNVFDSISNHYDELTSFPRMSDFFRLGNNLLLISKEKGIKLSILAFDFSGMKSFNMKYGFDKGDSLLTAFSKLLRKYFQDVLISRFGDDHFYILTKNANVIETVESIIKETPAINDGFSLPLRVGIYNGEIERITRACDKAKIAADIGRRNPLSSYHFYTDELYQEIEQSNHIINNLDKAIEEGWIKPFYQPIIRSINGKMCDEEALARWAEPDGKMISPAVFIPTLENAKLIHKLDLAILDQVLLDFERKKEKGLTNVPVSINISRYDFENCDIISEIKNRVIKANIPTSLISIEVTESIINVDKKLLKEQINRFHKEGFRVWMDDFGSGYSSLNALQEFNFDGIKIDMAFLSTFESNPKTPGIIKETIKIAEQLGIDTVCEGVENEKEREFLLNCGCAKLQGYLFSAPSSMEKILNMKHVLFRENPAEKGYYSLVSAISLDNPSTNGDTGSIAELAFAGTCDALLEIINGDVYLLRASPSFEKLCKIRNFICEKGDHGYKFLKSPDDFFMSLIEKTRLSGNWESQELITKRGTTSFMMRSVAFNPITGAMAFICVVSTYTVKPDEHKDYETKEDNIAISDLIEPLSFPVPFIIVNVLKGKGNEAGLKCLFANDEFCSLTSVPVSSIKNHLLKENFPDLNDALLRMVQRVQLTRKTVEGDVFSSASRLWLHCSVSCTKYDDCVLITFINLEKESNLPVEKKNEKDIYDEAYRLSTVFKLKENHVVKMEHVLYEFGKSSNCDNIGVVEIENETIKNKFEWSKSGVSKILDFSNYEINKLIQRDYFLDHDCFVVDSIESVREGSEQLYDWLKSKGIKRFIAVPLISQGGLVGLFMAGNFEIDHRDWTKKIMLKLSNIMTNEIILSRSENSSKKDSQSSKNETKRFSIKRLFSSLKEKFMMGKKTTTEDQLSDKENMRLAKPTSLMFAIFEIVFIPIFCLYTFFERGRGTNTYYTGDKWFCMHLIAYIVFLITNVSLFIYSTLYLKGKLDKIHHLSKKTRAFLDFYISMCFLYGIFLSVLSYQAGEQLIIFVILSLFSLICYRVYPFKAVFMIVFYNALLILLVYFAPLCQEEGVVLNMTFSLTTWVNLICLAIIEVAISFNLYYSRAKMISNSIIDRLSKTKLRFAIEEDFKYLINKPLVVMMLDVDNFKLLNDVYGHQAGDKILSKVGEALIKTFGNDSVYRYGGDEFLVIKKGDYVSFEEALKNLQPNFDSITNFETRITFSAGYKETKIQDFSSLDGAIRESDILLYEAKKRGKNQIVRGGVTFSRKEN